MMTLSTAISDFQQHLRAAGRTAGTIESYLHTLGGLANIVGNTTLACLTTEMLESAVVSLSVGRSATTMNRIKSTFRSFFSWAADSHIISGNPTAKLSLTRATAKYTEPIRACEIETFLNTIYSSGDRYSERDYTLFALYAFAGVRRAEALALRVMDYDAASRTLYLPRTKGGYARRQPVPRRLARVLERYITLLSQGNDLTCATACLFRGRNRYCPLSARQAHARFDKWKSASGIRNILKIHSFRTGFATLLHKHTGDLLLVARALGHSDIRTTQRYIAVDMDTVRDAVEQTFARFTPSALCRRK
jgi:site-specific recombinase XerD